MTRILKIDSGSDRSAIIEEAARALAAGGLCVFPTETVYGLAVNRDVPEAVARLDRVKRRAAGKPYTLMLADPDDVQGCVSKVPLIARRVIRRFWPGPLTVVFGDEGEEGLGVRVPASQTAREIVRAAEAPALVTSANVSDEPPATTARQAEENLDGLVDVIVDEGEAPLKEPSTVVRFQRGRWKVLREGIISEDMIAKQAHATLLFVCTGNSCRSALAEVFCGKLMAQRLGCGAGELEALGYRVLSAGTNAKPGGTAGEHARVVARETGCDLSAHTTRPLTRRLVDDADMIYAMTREHLQVIEEMGGGGKAALLADEAIPDPVGGDVASFRECAVEIMYHLTELMDELL
ncbi:MAG: threonylcarbamoyl-AMP synthase [Planctomycetes bacterium]|nr:threonylcarbamoyl-AMP synthase [Planctomycetota bacterium]